MKIATRNVLGIGATVIGLTAIATLSQVSFGQSTPTQSSEEGRYRLTVVVGSPGDSSTQVFLLDTKTGRCWRKATPSYKWVEDTPPGLATQ